MPTISALQSLIGAIPGGGIAVLAIWALIKKDAQCTALMAQLADIGKASAVTNSQVVSSIDALREAIKQGTRS
ncbi:MAG: hypothetical protein JOY99_11055 [Sphingomonadaceae bacterium]|nr:hypothetical protein [Sphingomonadaceae bacterium]